MQEAEFSDFICYQKVDFPVLSKSCPNVNFSYKQTKKKQIKLNSPHPPYKKKKKTQTNKYKKMIEIEQNKTKKGQSTE